MPFPAASQPFAVRASGQRNVHRWLEAGVAGLLALAVNIPYLGHPPQYDELYHILAAQSWAENGTFRIAEGVYTRAALFTALTGAMFRLFGSSIEVARIVPLLASATLTVMVFAWTRSVFGRPAAWLASILLTFSVGTMMMSQFVRFYTLHAALFFLGSVILFHIVERRPHTTLHLLGSIVAVVACMLLANHLQITTMIGGGALACWAMTRLLAPTLWNLSPRLRIAITALAAAMICVVIAALYFRSSLLDSLLGAFRSQALFMQNSSPLTYHWWLVSSYPVFYGLLPAVFVIALTRNPQATVFCAVTFTAALLVHSFGGMRGPHYVFYLSPFFFILCAAAMTAVPGRLRSAVGLAYSAVLSRAPTGRELTIATNALTAAVALFVVGSTPAMYKTFRVLAVGPYFLNAQYSVHWPAARPVLAGVADESDVVVTTNSLAAISYLGRHDIEFSATILAETDERNEFARDRRTGLPVISTADSLELLMRCYRSGLLITETWQWKNPIIGFGPEAAALIERQSLVELPAEANLLAYRWDNTSAELSSDCPRIKQYRQSFRAEH